MKKLILIVVAVLAAVQLYSQDRVSLIREKLLNRDQSTVIVASHRGDWRNYPENSLEAIDNAIKSGYWGTGCTTHQRRTVDTNA